MKEPNYEILFKKLLMMNQRGVYLTGENGHVYTNQDEDCEHRFKFKTILLNSKNYKGVISAIETFDFAIGLEGNQTLMEDWNTWGVDVLFLGDGKIDETRVDYVEPGKGGIG